VAREIAAGRRAGTAIRHTLERCACSSQASKHSTVPDSIRLAIDLLRSNDLEHYESYVETELTRLGLSLFCLEFALPLTTAVGDSWQSGALPMYAEHAFSQHLQALVSKQIPARASRRGVAPCFLLALPAGESHNLALTLLNALLLEAGVTTVLFQTGLPASDIAAAALAYHVDVVAVSCSLASGRRSLQVELTELRRLLTPNISMWVGGAGAARLPKRVAAVEYFSAMPDAVERAHALRDARSTNASPEQKGK
jgi:methylmalonyl-CoA mutase cobalamin-binding subunit